MNEPSSEPLEATVTPVTVDRSQTTCRNGDNHNDDNSLRQNGEKATIENGENESLFFHGLNNLI